MRNAYDKWLAGEGCCNAHNFVHIETSDCKKQDVCDCEHILLEISNLHTDDLVLQGEIDELSGDVANKLDASAYTPTDLTDYYTKEESDESFLTEHQPLKTINGQVISGTGNIEITASGGTINVDYALDSGSTNPVVNSAITEAINSKLDASAYTPADLTNYATKSELNQYITNLQEQINSLIAAVSGCCGSSGETQYRWITMTGDNDYWCSGTTKMSKEKEQSSTDGITWTDTGNIRSGSTVLEENCIECGYIETGSTLQMSYSSTTSPTTIANVCSSNVEHIGVAASPHSYTYTGCRTEIPMALSVGNIVDIYKSTNTVENAEYANTDLYKVGLSSEITSIGNGAFSGNTKLVDVNIGNFSRLAPTSQELVTNFTSIGDYAFSGCTNLYYLQISHQDFAPTLGTGAFDGCNLQAIYVKNSAVNTFKAAWPQYANIIQGL